MDAIRALISHSVRTELEDIPPQVVQRAKVALLDTLGVLIAGAGSDGVAPLLEQVRDWGGKPEATILVFGDRVPAPLAVFANAMMARSLDFDDCDEETGDHPSVAAVPAALVGAEMAGGASGRDLLTAIVIAVDAILRIRKASPIRLGPRLPWTTATFAPLTTAFAAGRAMRLDEETMANALGIAVTELSNTMQSHLDGAMAHRVHQGAAGQTAIAGIQLARRGITGIKEVLEGRFGLYNAYYHGEYDRKKLLGDLGERYLIEEVSIKPFPACKLTQGAAEGVLQLRREHGLVPSDVSSIWVGVNESAYMLCARQPWRAPLTVVDAQFSIPYVAAAALVRGCVTLAEFTPNSLRDPIILALAERVLPERDPAIDALGLQVAPTEVAITLRSGERLTRRVEHVPGHPLNPLDWAAIADKFRQCARRSPVPLAVDVVEAVIEQVAHLEELTDVRELVRILSPGAAR